MAKFINVNSGEICCACARLACVDPTKNEFARDAQGFLKCQLFLKDEFNVSFCHLLRVYYQQLINPIIFVWWATSAVKRK